MIETGTDFLHPVPLDFKFELDFDSQGNLILPEKKMEENIKFDQRNEFQELLKPSEVIRHHSLSLINTRHLMHQEREKHGDDFTIDQIPESEWKKMLKGYDMVWFMGIHKPSSFSQENAKIWWKQYQRGDENENDSTKWPYPDVDETHLDDVVPSPFAIPEYGPNPMIAPDWEHWDKMVDTLHGLGKKVIVDFVPNHTAVDHPLAKEHPEYYIQGTQAQYDLIPEMYERVVANDGSVHYLAHGKDPNCPQWSDTLQLNYASEEVQEFMKNTLLDLTKHADGVRCDMAMLEDAGTFIRTWNEMRIPKKDQWGNTIKNEKGEDVTEPFPPHLNEAEQNYIKGHDFWGTAIPEAKEEAKKQGKEDFLFMAEAYWDEDQLGENFDYEYNKKELYDKLNLYKEGKISFDDVKNIIKSLIYRKNRKYLDVNFIENHDEDAACRKFGYECSKAMAVLTGMLPDSIFLVNDGQPRARWERPPAQLRRPPTHEYGDPNMEAFYDRLLQLKQTKLFQTGKYEVIDIDTYDKILAIQVSDPEKPSTKAIVCINLSDEESKGRIINVTSTSNQKRNHEGEIIEDIKSQNLDVLDLMGGGFIDEKYLVPEKRTYGTAVKLSKWEAQVFFVSDKHPNTGSSTSEEPQDTGKRSEELVYSR